MMKLIDVIRRIIRRIMASVARFLNTVTGGRLHPDTVTYIGTAMHVPIAFLIAIPGWDIVAGILLLVFGLFDTLDGELARLQKRDSSAGMLLDASTDRMKEAMLYTGIGYTLATGAHPATAAWAAAAVGASICVSYVKAKGEAAVASAESKIPHATLNHMFKDGLLTFELRMFLLIVGLVTGWLTYFVAAIAVLSAYTALQRLQRISKVLSNV
jgi:CDP-diacylglycerol--glycerol-3-phosphate 3-phosphatidyltransferase